MVGFMNAPQLFEEPGSNTMNAVVERQATEGVQAPHPGTATTPSTLLAMAVAQGADLDRLERLMALQERWEAGEARKAFTQAMTDFKAEPLEIFKRKEVGYKTKEGDFVGYKHAQLCDVVDGYCVFVLKEAVDAGIYRRTGKKTLCLGPPETMNPGDYYSELATPAVSDREHAMLLKSAHAALCIDTGMQRFACKREGVQHALDAGEIKEAFTHGTREQHAAGVH